MISLTCLTVEDFWFKKWIQRFQSSPIQSIPFHSSYDCCQYMCKCVCVCVCMCIFKNWESWLSYNYTVGWGMLGTMSTSRIHVQVGLQVGQVKSNPQWIWPRPSENKSAELCGTKGVYSNHLADTSGNVSSWQPSNRFHIRRHVLRLARRRPQKKGIAIWKKHHLCDWKLGIRCTAPMIYSI